MKIISDNINSRINNFPAKCKEDARSRTRTSNDKQFELLSKNKETMLAGDCQLILGNSYTLNLRNPQLLELLSLKKKIIVGSKSDANISVDKFYSNIEDQHLVLEKQKNAIQAKNISSTSSVKYVPCNEITPFLTGCADIEMSQGNVGDCYLLAAIYALSHSKKGQDILKQMVKIEKDGSYLITFKNMQPICVKSDELDGETYKNGTVKRCVSGDLSLRAIERAYAKMIRKNSDIANMQQLDKGGFPQDALKVLADIDCTIVSSSMIESVLKEVKNNDYVLMCSTPHAKGQEKYVDKEKKFTASHAYAIKSFDIEKRAVEIVNPHNTKKSEIISLDLFKNIFNLLYVAKI